MIRISQCFRDQDLSVPRVDRLGVGSSSHNRWRSNVRDPRNGFVCRSSCVRWWAKPHSQVGVFTPKRAAAVGGSVRQRAWDDSSLYVSQLIGQTALLVYP